MQGVKMLFQSLMVKGPCEKYISLLQLISKLVATCVQRFSELQRNLCWSETTEREDVHPVMREFNIVTGYRHTGRGWRYYLRSACRLHNETMNWLSHAIGASFILMLSVIWTLHLRPTADQRDILIVWVFSTTSVLLHAASSVAHLMHNRSELWHCWVFFVDNAAVGLSGYANNLLSVTFFSSASYYNWIAPVTMPILVFGAICLSASFSWALASYRRQYNLTTSLLMFGPSGCYMLFGLVPIVHRQIELGSAADMTGVLHYSVFILAVLCYVVYFPERWWPGKFDLIGHSHQLFHCLVTASHSLLLWAAFSEIHKDGPIIFSKRIGNWISVDSGYRGLYVATAMNFAFVAFYAKAFQFDKKFTSKAARNKHDQ